MPVAFADSFQSLHLERVASQLALSAKGDLLALGLAAGDQRQPCIEIYETDSGSRIESYSPNLHSARGVYFAPNGDLYFAVDDQRHVILFVRTVSGGEPQEVAAYPASEAMNQVTGDDAGKYVAIAGRRADVMRRGDHRVVRTYLPAERLKPLTLCFSFDGRSAYVYGSVKKQVVQLEIESEKELGRWEAPQDYGRAVSASKSGRYLAALGYTQKGLFVYDTRSNARISARDFDLTTIAGPPVFVQDAGVVAPPLVMDLAGGRRLKIPSHPVGLGIATASCAGQPMIAYSTRQGDVMWARFLVS